MQLLDWDDYIRLHQDWICEEIRRISVFRSHVRCTFTSNLTAEQIICYLCELIKKTDTRRGFLSMCTIIQNVAPLVQELVVNS